MVKKNYCSMNQWGSLAILVTPVTSLPQSGEMKMV